MLGGSIHSGPASLCCRGVKYRVRGRAGPGAPRPASHPQPEINGMEFGWQVIYVMAGII